MQALGVWLDADQSEHSRIIVAGAARDDQLEPVTAAFRKAAQAGHGIILDLHGLEFFDTGFAGHILMLEKAAQRQSQPLTIIGASPDTARIKMVRVEAFD